MGGDPYDVPISEFARSLHDRWEISPGCIEARRIEDRKACLIVGADYKHWPIPDCIYRNHGQDGIPLYPSEKAIFGDIHPQEVYLIGHLSELLATLPAHKSLLAPLGVGGHVDHKLTRLAAENATSIRHLTYYEEYPYSRDETAVKRFFDSPEMWQPLIVALSQQDLERKIQAISCYHSQIGTFFDDFEDMIGQVKMHNEIVGGERLWSAV
jgi:LmbE family N-acetylglucosaminyl deacetylase